MLFAQYELFKDPPQWVLDERMIGSATAERYGVKWDRGRILPIRDARTHLLMGWQFKRLDFVSNYPKQVKKSQTLFGLDQIARSQTDPLTACAVSVTLVESPLDVVRLASVSIPAVAFVRVVDCDTSPLGPKPVAKSEHPPPSMIGFDLGPQAGVTDDRTDLRVA